MLSASSSLVKNGGECHRVTSVGVGSENALGKSINVPDTGKTEISTLLYFCLFLVHKIRD